ncbi:MAG TPA: hypothetical protein ENJ50_05775, partial [Planctomycetaceae bacterium]|nr:hypothetical protein [Planctomycetaceae bacterium]
MSVDRRGRKTDILRACASWSMGSLMIAALVGTAAAQVDVVPEGKALPDARLEPLKDLNGYFPFEVPSNVDAWKERATQVRRRVQVALGLWPPPTKTPLHPVIHGKRDMGDYTIEKVYFESMPGFFVTGNLYRPKKLKGKVPGVLCSHGHWAKG